MTDKEITLVLRYLEDPNTFFTPMERQVLYQLAGDLCTVDMTETKPMLLSGEECVDRLIDSLPTHIRVALILTK
jgi:hypothetical protein